MCLHSIYFIVFHVIQNSLLYWTCLLNPLTWAIMSLLPCHWSCSRLTLISVLRVVMWKLHVKPAVYNCIPAHSNNQSKNHRMPEAMAVKTWSQENLREKASGIWWQLLWQVHPAWWGSSFSPFLKKILFTHR